MKDQEAHMRIDQMEGRLIAAQIAIRALIACHPNPEKAIATVSEHLNRIAAIGLGGAWPDLTIDALATAESNLIPNDEEVQRARRL